MNYILMFKEAKISAGGWLSPVKLVSGFFLLRKGYKAIHSGQTLQFQLIVRWTDAKTSEQLSLVQKRARAELWSAVERMETLYEAKRINPVVYGSEEMAAIKFRLEAR